MKALMAVLAAALLLLAGCGTTVKGAAGAVSAGGSLGSSTAASAGAGAGTASTLPGLAPSSGATAATGAGAAGAAGVAGTSSGAGWSAANPAAAATTPGIASGSSPKSAAASKGPIQLGFIVTNVSNAGQFGVNAGQTFTDQQLYSALVAAMNAQGGIGGRQISPVFSVTDTASASWISDFQAACANFTQDHHVAAVVGYIFVYLDAFEQCLAKAGVPHLYGGYQPGDTTAQRAYPTLVATTNPTGDVHYRIGLAGAVTSGVLTPRNKLGLIVDSCANDDQAFKRVGAPYLQSQHITYETFDVGCSTGASQDGTAVSEIQSAELQFRAHGVDTVFVEGVPALLFAEDVESQGWHPSYLMTDAGAAFEGNVPNDQLANFHGFGWMPSVDVDPSHQPYPWNASEKRCLQMLSSQGLVPKGYNDYMEAFTTCDGLFLYAAALSTNGGQTAAGPVVSALATVMGKTQLTSTYGGVGSYNSNQHGGPAFWRQWGWATSCSCFQYVGASHPIS